MQISFASLIPSCIACRSGDADSDSHAACQIEQTIKSVAKAAGLGRQGQQTLLQWTIWSIYANALTIHDPHLAEQPGWSVVLPIDQVASRTNLRLLLLRAGESAQAAQDAVQAFYTHDLIPDIPDSFMAFDENTPALMGLGATLGKEAAREWMSRLPTNDLPPYGVPFETLPAWARETALFATDMAGKDCRGMPGLNGLDLRYLSAPRVNLEGCNLSYSNFDQADLYGANWKHTYIHGTVMPLRR